MRKKDFKQLALEEFLNDEVLDVTNGLYMWHKKYYQVMLRANIAVKGMKFDSFIRYEYKGKVYGIREMSDNLLKKYYMTTEKGA